MASTDRLRLLTEAVSFATDFENSSNPALSYFPEDVFAKLEGPQVDTYLRSMKVILGNSMSKTANVRLPGPLSTIADRHAMIFYSFERETFQIQCLCDGVIYVNNIAYGPRDKPAILGWGSLIRIGNTQFRFILSPYASKKNRSRALTNVFHFNTGVIKPSKSSKRTKSLPTSDSLDDKNINLPKEDTTTGEKMKQSEKTDSSLFDPIMPIQNKTISDKSSSPKMPIESYNQEPKSFNTDFVVNNSSTSYSYDYPQMHIPIPYYQNLPGLENERRRQTIAVDHTRYSKEKPPYTFEFLIAEVFQRLNNQPLNVDHIMDEIANSYAYYQNAERHSRLLLGIKLCLAGNSDKFAKIIRPNSSGRNEVMYSCNLRFLPPPPPSQLVLPYGYNQFPAHLQSRTAISSHLKTETQEQKVSSKSKITKVSKSKRRRHSIDTISSAVTTKV